MTMLMETGRQIGNSSAGNESRKKENSPIGNKENAHEFLADWMDVQFKSIQKE